LWRRLVGLPEGCYGLFVVAELAVGLSEIEQIVDLALARKTPDGGSTDGVGVFERVSAIA
jgi:hypothetical protein